MIQSQIFLDWFINFIINEIKKSLFEITIFMIVYYCLQNSFIILSFYIWQRIKNINFSLHNYYCIKMAKYICCYNNRFFSSMRFSYFFNKIFFDIIFARIKTCIKICLSFKLFLLLNPLSLLKFNFFKSRWMIITNLPKKIQLVINNFLRNRLQIINYLKISNPISQITLLLTFIHFIHKFFNLQSSIFSNCLHYFINIRT